MALQSPGTQANLDPANNIGTQTRQIDEFSGLGFDTGYVTPLTLEQRLQWGISFGMPINVDDQGNLSTNQLTSEVRGSWCTVSMVAATGTVVLNHQLGIPAGTVTGAGGTANLPNCRWFLVGLEYGDRTGATAAPAVPAGTFAVSFIKMVNGTVTANAITLQYAVTGFTPDATHPLTATFFVVAAAA